jgi:hypothetical protein
MGRGTKQEAGNLRESASKHGIQTMQLVTTTPTAAFMTMTRELVDALLALNTKNRNLRALVVSTYQRAVEVNMWVPTNQGIGVAAKGFLVDGQHRLEALRAAGYPPVLMLVVTGLPDEAMAAVDGGTNRNARDYMQFMFDTKVSAFVSALLRTSMLARDDFAAIKYLPQEYATHLEDLGESIAEIMNLEHVSKLPAAVVAALVDAHHKGYQAEVQAFAKALATGEMLERDNPALVLRNWIANTKGNGGATTLIERYRKTTRALQAWIDQRPLGKLYRKNAPLIAARKNSGRPMAGE